MTTEHTSQGTTVSSGNGTARLMGILTIIAGIVLIVAGAATMFLVTDQLKAEKITVAKDAPCMAGELVDGPISAYCQAQIINTHVLEDTGGLTYAELPRDDPMRTVAMNGSFLRASLFTSVVAYGVAWMALGLGLVCVFVGIGLSSLAKRR